MENGFMGRPEEKVPEMTDEICESISRRYIELYESVTGCKFVPGDETRLSRRIENNILDCLATLGS